MIIDGATSYTGLCGFSGKPGFNLGCGPCPCLGNTRRTQLLFIIVVVSTLLPPLPYRPAGSLVIVCPR